MSPLPKLSLHYGSSAQAISQREPVADLPKVLAYPPQVIHAAPKTDLWRKPPNTNVDNCPTYLISTPIDLHKFHSAKVTVSANWNTLYDQGGLVLFIPDEDITKWVKTGIEFFDGKPYSGTVATSRWSDWSLVPLPESAGGKITLQVERETKNGERVESLWIYLVDPVTGEKSPLRELTWFFRHDVLGGEEPSPDASRSLLVGIYAARPTVPTGEGREEETLEVHLDGFEVTLFDN